ncbi:MAG: hypothetical protein ABIK93_08050 [candidate division WOR-3 bacterium]
MCQPYINTVTHYSPNNHYSKILASISLNTGFVVTVLTQSVATPSEMPPKAVK